jgi:hypothetical protein
MILLQYMYSFHQSQMRLLSCVVPHLVPHISVVVV